MMGIGFTEMVVVAGFALLAIGVSYLLIRKQK